MSERLEQQQTLMHLYCQMFITSKSLRDRLGVDKLIKRGAYRADGRFFSSNDNSVIIQLSNLQVITKEELAIYFGIKNSEKGAAFSVVQNFDIKSHNNE